MANDEVKNIEKVEIKENDLVYDNNKALYRGIYNSNDETDHISLESRALVTEQ